VVLDNRENFIKGNDDQRYLKDMEDLTLKSLPHHRLTMATANGTRKRRLRLNRGYLTQKIRYGCF